MAQSLNKAAIVVVTYKRQELLAGLFDSILQLTQAPWRIVVVDNENSAETAVMVQQFSDRATSRWGKTIIDSAGNQERVVYTPQDHNGGGAGGFSVGVKKAYDLGAHWFWVMDDDVAVEPKGLDVLSKWADKYQVIQGSRLDYDNGSFYWQYHFINSLGIPDPIAPAGFGSSGCKTMNTMCFEGAFFSRKIVEQIGLPDPRFFIYWDDTIYGYLASKVTQPVVVSDVIMRRTRELGNWDIAGVRQLNSTSDMNRYHIMRNRGYMARYFMIYGDYRPVMFALGTAATAVKEVIRLFAVDRGSIFSGIPQLFHGWLDSRKLMHDPNWKPMPALK
jgi:rhamnopyranosyl-N-acetylglucosaminyl-diphospho-decaprenol beta-1,3/1,4-galactofuranosyltransferase